MNNTYYFYHSSHGDVIPTNPIVDVDAQNSVYPFKYSKPDQEIEIIISNRAAMGHTIRTAQVTQYGDIERNFNPDLFENYMKINSKGGIINKIEVGAAGSRIKTFYDNNPENTIKLKLPNILFTYDDDFNMGVFEMIYDGIHYKPIDKNANVWENLCYKKPDNPKKIEYLHDSSYSLLDNIIKFINDKNKNEDKIKIYLFNSTCLYVENSYELYNLYPEWGIMFDIYLALGQEKMAREQQTKIQNIDYLIRKQENRIKMYDMMNPKDPVQAQTQLYGKVNAEQEIEKLKQKKQKKTLKRDKRFKQSIDIKNEIRKKKPQKRIAPYRRPMPLFWQGGQKGGIRFKNVVTFENYKQNINRPIKFLGKFNKKPLNYTDTDFYMYESLQQLYDYQQYDNLIVNHNRNQHIPDGYIPIGKQTESGYNAYVRVPINLQELKRHLHDFDMHDENMPEEFYHFEYINNSQDLINSRYFKNRHKSIKNKTYKRGVRELMINQDLPDEIGKILFENLKI